MKLYEENKSKKFDEIFELNHDNNQKDKILYMMANSNIIKNLTKSLKREKLITFKSKERISKIINSGFLKSIRLKNNESKYNLIIVCTGNNSDLVKKIFKDETFIRSYEEVSITTTLKHNFLKNNTARQFFLNNAILALLPISNTKTSIVWSVKKEFIKDYKINKSTLLKKRIKFLVRNYFKKIKFISKIEYKDLNLIIRKKYFSDRVLLFGDALHLVHPLAGQGFNMVLRDLRSLEKVLKNKINLGLDIGNSNILLEVTNKIKPRNLVYSLSIDLIKKIFSNEKKSFKNLRNNFLGILNNNNFAKNIFFDLANKGLKFLIL